MYTEQEILAILSNVMEMSKKAWDKTGDLKYNESNIPEFWPGYKKAIRDHERIRVHTEVEYFPQDVILKKAPNQSEREFKYVKDNLKKTCIQVATDFLTLRSKAWNESNWTIKYEEDSTRFKNEPYQDYVEKDIKHYTSLKNFGVNILPKLRVKDAQGVIAIKPYHMHMIEVVDGVYKEDDKQLRTPIPYYYPSKRILAQHVDEYFMILLPEKSMVKVGDNIEKTGRIFEFYDNYAIWRIEETRKNADGTSEWNIWPYYVHELNKVPVHKLMGIPEIDDDYGYLLWESSFLPACDPLDLTIKDSATLDSSKNKTAFPFTVMVGGECDFIDDNHNACNGTGSITFWSELEGKDVSKTCPSCNGSGTKNRISPLGELLINPEEIANEKYAGKHLYYVAPPVDILEFMDKQIDKNESRARRMLHMHRSQDTAEGGKDITATAEGLEYDSQKAFLTKDIEQDAIIIRWMYNIVGEMRYGSEFKKPTFIFPVDYDFITEEDYLMRLKRAKDAGAPPLVTKQIIISYLQSKYFKEKEVQNIVRLIIEADELLELTSEEIDIKLGNRSIELWQDILHRSAQTLVNEILVDEKSLFDKPLNEQVSILIDRAKEKAAERNSNPLDTLI